MDKKTEIEGLKLCSKCKEHHFRDKCVCKEFQVCIPAYYGDEWIIINAKYAEKAVESIVECYDSENEWEIANGAGNEFVEVHVKIEGRVKKFQATGAHRPEYHLKELED